MKGACEKWIKENTKINRKALFATLYSGNK